MPSISPITSAAPPNAPPATSARCRLRPSQSYLQKLSSTKLLISLPVTAPIIMTTQSSPPTHTMPPKASPTSSVAPLPPSRSHSRVLCAEAKPPALPTKTSRCQHQLLPPHRPLYVSPPPKVLKPTPTPSPPAATEPPPT